MTGMSQNMGKRASAGGRPEQSQVPRDETSTKDGKATEKGEHGIDSVTGKTIGADWQAAKLKPYTPAGQPSSPTHQAGKPPKPSPTLTTSPEVRSGSAASARWTAEKVGKVMRLWAELPEIGKVHNPSLQEAFRKQVIISEVRRLLNDHGVHDTDPVQTSFRQVDLALIKILNAKDVTALPSASPEDNAGFMQKVRREIKIRTGRNPG